MAFSVVWDGALKWKSRCVVFTVSRGIWFPDMSLAAYGEFLFQSASPPGIPPSRTMFSAATSVKEHFEILLNVFIFFGGVCEPAAVTLLCG